MGGAILLGDIILRANSGDLLIIELVNDVKLLVAG